MPIRTGERTKALLSAFSRNHKVQIFGGSIAEKRSDGVYNTTYVFNELGEIHAEYSKIHLFRLMDEEKHLQSGDKLGQLNVSGTDAGMMICYDIRFPELARKLAINGAKLLFVPAQWPIQGCIIGGRCLWPEPLRIKCSSLLAIACGTSGTSTFFGHSLIIDPWGEIIAEAGEEESIIRAEIDLALVDAIRSKIPVFEDRRPQLY